VTVHERHVVSVTIKSNFSLAVATIAYAVKTSVICVKPRFFSVIRCVARATELSSTSNTLSRSIGGLGLDRVEFRSHHAGGEVRRGLSLVPVTRLIGERVTAVNGFGKSTVRLSWLSDGVLVFGVAGISTNPGVYLIS
jgi:hypothetical protein